MKLPNIKSLFKPSLPSIERDVIAKPHRDWHALLLLFFVLCVGISTIHYLLFLNLGAAKETVVKPISAGKNLQKKDLLEIITLYRAKAATLEGLQNSPPNVADPSL